MTYREQRIAERRALKEMILKCEFDRVVAKASHQAFVYNDNSTLKALEDWLSPEVVQMSKQLNNARYKRCHRCQDRIGLYLKLGVCQFLTLTFTDDVLESTTMETRRTYVRRFLKRNCWGYVANIDFGNDGVKRRYFDVNGELNESTAREHYHALVFAPRVNYDKWHKYGAIFAEKIGKKTKDLKRVARYVAKLSNHAMKMNNGIAPRLLYSRENNAIRQILAGSFY